MKIVSISDTHGRWNKVKIPKCDLLISAGDYSFRGEKHMDGVSFFNSAICDEKYYPSNAPHVIEFNPNERKME